jgi:serine/threonine protein kinase
MSFQPGMEIAGYRLERLIGQGGMGVVYEATQISLNRTVALKLVSPDLGQDVTFNERFRREGLLQAGLDHPHVVTVYEAGEFEGTLFIAMRMVHGSSLKALITDRELDAGRTLRILGPVADALDSAHEAGLIHRDVKPHNILVGRRDHGYLADFGLTKARDGNSLTRTGQFVGTLDYVAPEQIRGERATGASDVYAFGAVLFECLTGVVPFPKDSEAAVLYAHMADDPPKVTEVRPELPDELDRVLERAMAKDPADRHPSVVEVIDEAQRAFARKTRAAMAVPAPVERPEEAGERPPEAEVPTAPRRGPKATPSTTDLPARPAAPPLAREPAVGATPGPATAPESQPPSRSGRRSRSTALLGGGLALAAAAAGGAYAIGHSGVEPPAGSRVVDRGLVTLSAPTSWAEQQPPQKLRGLPLQHAVALQSGDRRTTLLVGRLPEPHGERLLPESFLSAVDAGKLGTNDTVRLGAVEAYRYRNVMTAQGEPVTVYAGPTTKGIVGAACISSPASEAGCERILNTLDLRSGKPRPLGLSAEYGEALNAAVRHIAAGRAETRRADGISHRRQARRYAAATRRFETARTTVLRATPSPGAERYDRNLTEALRGLVDAYRSLKLHAHRAAPAAYAKRRADARRAYRQVTSALEDLAELGYGTLD